jgi:hypothetical protein
MNEVYLTAAEIYEIDKLNDATLGDFISKLSHDKKELALHVFAKIRALNVSKVMLDECNEYISNLEKVLEENGITTYL